MANWFTRAASRTWNGTTSFLKAIPDTDFSGYWEDVYAPMEAVIEATGLVEKVDSVTQGIKELPGQALQGIKDLPGNIRNLPGAIADTAKAFIDDPGGSSVEFLTEMSSGGLWYNLMPFEFKKDENSWLGITASFDPIKDKTLAATQGLWNGGVNIVGMVADAGRGAWRHTYNLGAADDDIKEKPEQSITDGWLAHTQFYEVDPDHPHAGSLKARLYAGTAVSETVAFVGVSVVTAGAAGAILAAARGSAITARGAAVVTAMAESSSPLMQAFARASQASGSTAQFITHRALGAAQTGYTWGAKTGAALIPWANAEKRALELTEKAAKLSLSWEKAQRRGWLSRIWTAGRDKAANTLKSKAAALENLGDKVVLRGGDAAMEGVGGAATLGFPTTPVHLAGLVLAADGSIMDTFNSGGTFNAETPTEIAYYFYESANPVMRGGLAGRFDDSVNSFRIPASGTDDKIIEITDITQPLKFGENAA